METPMPDEQVVELKVGCHPEAAVSGAVLLQSDNAVFLLFNAMSDETNSQGRYEDVGAAVINFTHCKLTRFGGPNDEGLPEHPLYHKGLAQHGYSICEVVNSSWAAEVMERAKKSARRIWGDRFQHAYKDRKWTTRHFIITFHDSTFECLADDLILSIHKDPFPQIVEAITHKMAEG
jgi:hypothetical protein